MGNETGGNLVKAAFDALLTALKKAFNKKSSGKRNQSSSSNFEGTLRGNAIVCPNVETTEFLYEKRKEEDRERLRSAFNNSVRGNFVEHFHNKYSDVELKVMGFSDVDIKKMSDRYVPDGYQVHHKYPLDDSGTNDFSNLILIKNDPYHIVITNYQKSITHGMLPNDSRTVVWPIPKGDYYNG